MPLDEIYLKARVDLGNFPTFPKSTFADLGTPLFGVLFRHPSGYCYDIKNALF
jgi:hypothetical protein